MMYHRGQGFREREREKTRIKKEEEKVDFCIVLVRKK
jgi:hypothetical protein